MNERIKQLANEAGLLVHNPNGVPTKLEKFAELIVRECCQKLENDGMVEVAIEMKQHFGVEE
jgi:hypothetical protein